MQYTISKHKETFPNAKIMIVSLEDISLFKHRQLPFTLSCYHFQYKNIKDNVKIEKLILQMDKISINLLGRLGNIMFEYATVKYLAEKFNKQCYVNFYNAYPKDEILKYFNSFDIFKNVVTENILYNTNINIEPYDCAHKYIEINNNDNYITGYRLSPKYWNNNRSWAKKLYKMPVNFYDYIKKIYNLNFEDIVSIHIRRGDYLNAPNNYFVLSLNDINKYILLYNDSQKFLIISDDLVWCKENLIGEQFIFADKISTLYSQELVDLYLQTLCKDNIISNSSFSWWGAYLNIHDNNKVYYKMPWHKDDKYTDIIPENDNWIEIK